MVRVAMSLETSLPSDVAERTRRLAARDEDYVLEDQVGYCLRLAMQRHTAIFMSSMIEDLTQPQFAALAKLHVVGRCSQNQLGRLVALDVATIKGVVDRLEARVFRSEERRVGKGSRL